MRVFVDTCVWSLFLRRKPKVVSSREKLLITAMRELIVEGRAIIAGAVRQELLSGIRESAAFDELCEYLQFFDDEAVEVADYEQAARFHNHCRAHGIAGSSVDMLLCSMAERRNLSVFTTDGDFARYSLHLPIRLYPHP